MQNTLVVGDCHETLARWAQDGVRVQCVVTSPPYWGLRDYGTATWDGGDPVCDHTAVRRGHGEDEKQATSAGTSRDPIRGGDCRLCGATRTDNQLGLEATPEAYVAHMVEVFRLVRDVLADDGVCWLNLGDSYIAAQGGRQMHAGELPGAALAKVNTSRERVGITSASWSTRDVTAKMTPARGTTTLKPKDLAGIPWRVALALQADGWYLRADVIWAKPNPMPESVTDRPTKAHEYLFLLTKRERYFYDAEAIKEPGEMKPQQRFTNGKGPKAEGYAAHRQPAGMTSCEWRNRRSVWSIATQPYPEAHFATFPPDLVTPCILAGSRPGDTVLDPFMGAGTVAMVAQDLGRRWLGCELNPAYAAMCEARTRQQGLVLHP